MPSMISGCEFGFVQISWPVSSVCVMGEIIFHSQREHLPLAPQGRAVVIKVCFNSVSLHIFKELDVCFLDVFYVT